MWWLPFWELDKKCYSSSNMSIIVLSTKNKTLYLRDCEIYRSSWDAGALDGNVTCCLKFCFQLNCCGQHGMVVETDKDTCPQVDPPEQIHIKVRSLCMFEQQHLQTWDREKYILTNNKKKQNFHLCESSTFAASPSYDSLYDKIPHQIHFLSLLAV